MIEPMTPTAVAAGGDGVRGVSRRRDPGLLVALTLLVVGSFAALSVDVPRTLLGIKGDEATYVAMALSVAYDRDLVYQRGDLERFFAVYNGGPEGIYLKRGARSFYQVDGTFPFIHRETYPDGRDDQLFFGKAYMSSLFAAPFVWVAGLNGLLWFNVVLLTGVVFGAYRFVAARSPALVALPFVLAFLGASIAPLYAVWLSSEIFNFSFVFFAYLLWFYKHVAGPSTTRLGRWLRGPWSDLAAAVLLGLAIFSKPLPHVLLILPPVLHLWWLGRPRHGFAVGLVCAGVAAGGFALNAGISGEFNYQGGLDRRYVSGHFPFEGPGFEFDDLGTTMTTDGIVIEEPLGPVAFLTLLIHNLRYFLVGRHFGFIPFFFPGVVVLLLFLWFRVEAQVWHWLILATAALAAVTLAVYMPYTWSGGGGPSGNRYYLSAYPLFLFLTPTLRGHGPAIAAWVGGALFTAQILMNPSVSAKQPYLASERGAFRSLPVELTMVLDLPIMLDATRARVIYGDDPTMQLYFLDHNASLPEPPGIWIAGERRADIIVRTPMELETITVTARAPIATVVSIEIGHGGGRIALQPQVPGSVTIRPGGVYSRRSWAYLMQVTSSDGFVPRLIDSGSDDPRFLGAAISLTAVPLRAR